MPMRLVLLASMLATTLGLGCGATVRVEPLIGDDEELLGYVASAVPTLDEHAPTLAARALYEALTARDWERAWDLLTPESHAALDALAAHTGAAPNGKSILLQGFETGIPLTRADGKELRVEPLRCLLVANLAWFERSLDPEEKPHETASEAIIYAVDANHDYRQITLRNMDGRWRVHQPSLRFEDVAPLLSSTR